MVQPSEVMPLLLAACPTFQPRWDEHLDWWEGEDRGHYNDTGEFAVFLRDQLGDGNTEQFPAVFAVIESVVVRGSEDARGLIIVGLLESLQNLGSHTEQGYEPFVQWLGPFSLRAWRELEDLWADKQSLMDVIRADRKGER